MFAEPFWGTLDDAPHLFRACSNFLLQVVTVLSAEDFVAWEVRRSFDPEAEFVEMLKAIDGISDIEAQSYTVS